MCLGRSMPMAIRSLLASTLCALRRRGISCFALPRLYGKHPCRAKGGLNFVELMRKLAREGKEIKVVDSEFVTPTVHGGPGEANRQAEPLRFLRTLPRDGGGKLFLV